MVLLPAVYVLQVGAVVHPAACVWASLWRRPRRDALPAMPGGSLPGTTLLIQECPQIAEEQVL